MAPNRRIEASFSMARRVSKIAAGLILIGAAVAFPIRPGTTAEPAAPSEASPTDSEAVRPPDSLLDKMDRAADLYRETALKFACTEEIVYRIRLHRERHKFSYVFVFDDDGNLRNHRVRWRRRPSPKVRTFDLAELDFPVLENAFIWVFVFKKERHRHHRYEMLGEDELWGRPVSKIRFVPVGTKYKGLNEWAGDAWVDTETGEVLKVSAFHRHNYRYFLAAERARELYEGTGEPGAFAYERVTTEFRLRKHGLRFPSRTEIEGLNVTVPRGAWKVDDEDYTVTQKYSEYEVFSVETKQDIGPAVPPDR